MPAGIPSSKFPKTDPTNVREIFADSMGMSFLDGNTLRLEFCIVRMDDPNPSDVGKKKPPSGKRHVVARLVLSAEGAVELVNQISKFAAIMEQTGMVKIGTPGLPPTAAH